MSRSRKKSPFTGFTSAKSDQPWKARAARIFRRTARQGLRADTDGAALPVKRWSVVSPWDAPKDGKQRLTSRASRWLRK